MTPDIEKYLSGLFISLRYKMELKIINYLPKLENLADINRSLNDELSANESWFLYILCGCYVDFLDAFKLLQSHEFYDAWCILERIEIRLYDLLRNNFIPKLRPNASLLLDVIMRWQALFLYYLFFSPEFTKVEEECSVCRAKMSPWSDCGHRRGFVYHGMICHSIVTSAQFIGVALVRDPVQKYSVAFAQNADGTKRDQYDYSVVRFVADRLRSPFSDWKYYKTKARFSTAMLGQIDPAAPCPCRSGLTYRVCCVGAETIEFPHIEFVFAEAPDPSLPNLVLPKMLNRGP